MGGECNYLLRVAGPDKRLQFVPDAEWKSPFTQSWTRDDCERLLDAAERLLLEGAHRLRLPVSEASVAGYVALSGKALNIRMDARPSTVGTFASQIRHFELVRNFMTSSTLFILADAPFALMFVGVMAMLAGPVALVPLVMVPIAVLSGMFFQGAIEQLTGENMAESNRKNGLLIEAVDGIESVKAAGGEWKMLDRWRSMTSTMADSELKMRQFSTLSSNLTQTIQQLSYAGMIAAGAYAINAGHLTMGGLIACSIISGRALTPVAQLLV